MNLELLKKKVDEIEKDKNALQERFNSELDSLKDFERETIQEYIKKNAKYDMAVFFFLN